MPEDLVVHLRADLHPRPLEGGEHVPPGGPQDPPEHHFDWILCSFHPFDLFCYLSQPPVVFAAVNLVHSEKRLVGVDLDLANQVPQVVGDLLAPDEPLFLHGLYEEVPRDPNKGFEAQIRFENLGNGCCGQQGVSGLAPDADGGGWP